MSNKLIGTKPNQVPTNSDLGEMAYQNKDDVTLAAASKTALTVKRKDDDGDLVKLKRDVTTAGQLGVYASGAGAYLNASSYLSLRIAGGDILTLVNGNLYPTTDAGLNLGLSNRHFNNLHMSGTAYIDGGIESASYSHLDDLPNIRPSLLLDFANSKTLDPRITFTRGSTATYWDGKTTTKAEENLVVSNASAGSDVPSMVNARLWVGGGTGTEITAPDGSSDVRKWGADTSNGEHTSYLLYSSVGALPPSSDNKNYTWSAYFKRGSGYDYGTMRMYNMSASGAQIIQVFDLVNGTLSTLTDANGDLVNATITDVGNGWYRCSITFPYKVTGGSVQVGFAPNNSSGITYTGDGTSYGYHWGFQMEQRDAPTAYTATASGGPAIVKYQPTLQTAASGEARFDHDPVTGESKGLLIEESRTNLATASSYSGAAVSNITKIDNSRLAPTGYIATEFKPTTTSGLHRSSYTITLPNTNTVTYSIYAKSNGVDYFALNDLDQAQRGAGFDLTGDGNVISGSSGTGRIEKLNNGWFRCSVTFTPANTTTAFNIEYRTFLGVSYESVAFNGFDGVFLTGFQVEQGSFPTSYIPTSGSTVTRSLDGAKITGNNFNSVIPSSAEFSAYAEATAAVKDDNRIWTISENASQQERILANFQDAWQLLMQTDGSTATSLDAGTVTVGTYSKIGYRLQLDNNAVCIDGGNVVSDTETGRMPRIDALYIGANFGGTTNLLNGTIKKLAFYPQSLSDATLQAMTEE